MKNKFNCIAFSLMFCAVISKGVAQVETNRFTEHADKFIQLKAEKSIACGDSKGVELSWENKSNEPMDLQYAIQRPDGTWHVRTILNVQPHAKVENISYCKSMGNQKWWARPSRDVSAKPFPSIENIKAGSY